MFLIVKLRCHIRMYNYDLGVSIVRGCFPPVFWIVYFMEHANLKRRFFGGTPSSGTGGFQSIDSWDPQDGSVGHVKGVSFVHGGEVVRLCTLLFCDFVTISL